MPETIVTFDEKMVEQIKAAVVVLSAKVSNEDAVRKQFKDDPTSVLIEYGAPLGGLSDEEKRLLNAQIDKLNVLDESSTSTFPFVVLASANGNSTRCWWCKVGLNSLIASLGVGAAALAPESAGASIAAFGVAVVGAVAAFAGLSVAVVAAIFASVFTGVGVITAAGLETFIEKICEAIPGTC